MRDTDASSGVARCQMRVADLPYGLGRCEIRDTRSSHSSTLKTIPSRITDPASRFSLLASHTPHPAFRSPHDVSAGAKFEVDTAIREDLWQKPRIKTVFGLF